MFSFFQQLIVQTFNYKMFLDQSLHRPLLTRTALTQRINPASCVCLSAPRENAMPAIHSSPTSVHAQRRQRSTWSYTSHLLHSAGFNIGMGEGAKVGSWQMI